MRRSKVAHHKTRPYLRVPADDDDNAAIVTEVCPEEIHTENGLALLVEDDNA